MKQFDDILKENVDKAFSSYNADHLADEGWNSFLAKRNGKKKALIFIFPFWAKAATIALLIGLGGLIAYVTLNRRSGEEPSITKTGISPAEKPSSAVNIPVAAPVSNITAVISSTHKEQNPAVMANNFQPALVSGIQPVKEIERKEMPAVIADTVQQPAMAENKLPADNDTIKPADKNKIMEPVSEEPVQTASEETGRRSRSTTFMTGLSGVLAHVNNAPNTTTGMSVGIYVDQRISRRISFRPGLALAMNSLGFSNTNSSPAVASTISFADKLNGTPESFDGQLSMVTMEVPLNIVYKVFERKNSSFFLSAGTSTMIYLSQHFTGDVMNEYSLDKINASTGMTYTETVYSNVNVDNTYAAFSRTDYFGLASISAGYSLPFGKTSTLLIEPFMQFPLSKLTSLDLQVHYAGVSMKVGFGRKKE